MTNRARQRSGIATVVVSACAVVAMCAFIFVMSAFDADDSTELSMGVVWHIIGFIVPGYDQMSLTEQLYWQQTLDHPVRKTAHFLEYAVLGALMLNLVVRVARLCGGAGDSKASASSPVPKLVIIAWALATAYAVTDEIHQMFVPGRSCELGDMLLDSVGVLVGVVLLALMFAKHNTDVTRRFTDASPKS